jgi:hypothetical protein
MGSHGRRADFDAAHDWAFILNAIRGMGGVGAFFHASCLLETTTIAFQYKDVAQCAPHGAREAQAGIASLGEEASSLASLSSILAREASNCP